MIVRVLRQVINITSARVRVDNGRTAQIRECCRREQRVLCPIYPPYVSQVEVASVMPARLTLRTLFYSPSLPVHGKRELLITAQRWATHRDNIDDRQSCGGRNAEGGDWDELREACGHAGNLNGHI